MGTSFLLRKARTEPSPAKSSRESTDRLPGIYLVALVLYALVATASTVWVLRREHAKEISYWSERLTRVADTNTLLFKLWIQQRDKDAQIMASYPTAKASVLQTAGTGPAEHARAHTAAILDLARDPDIYSALYILDDNGRVVTSSSGAPIPQPEILQACRTFANVGVLTLFEPGKDAVFPPLAVIAPIRKPVGVGNPQSELGGIAGSVVLVTQRDILTPLFHTDVATTGSGETLFVARRGKDVVFVSPFRNRPKGETGAPQTLDAGTLGLLALEGREVFGEYSDPRGVAVLAVTRLIPEIGWGMVTKIDREEALAHFRETVVQDLAVLLVSLGALASFGFGLQRHQQVHGLRTEIARRRQTEEELQQSEQRFFTAFRSSPEGMSITTLKDGRYLEANDVFLRTLGYEREELVGRTSADLKIWAHPQDRDAMIQKLHSGELIREMEMNACTKSGQIRQVLLSLEAIQLQDEVCLLAALRDITDHKLLEEELRQAQKMEAVGRLAGGVAHDFNNLLAIMMGYSELLVEKLAVADPNHKIAEQIFEATKRASDVTQQLLAFSRRQVLWAKVVDINTVVGSAQKLLRPLIGEDIELIVRLGPDAGWVKADPGQLVQVIMNLAVNARDAMPEGGRLMIETANVIVDEAYARTHPPQKPGAYVMLVVSDTGHGMDEPTQSHLFEPFFTTKDPGKGTGLGLSTVYGIVKQSSGFIWAESKLGQSTTFRIYLPHVAQPGNQEEHIEPASEPVGGCETILIAEDELSLRRMTRESLEIAGYRVLEATDVYDALRIAEQHQEPIHMLVTDVIMPKMSGPVLAQKVRKIRAGIRVIYVSGHADSSVQDQLTESDASFLHKPFSRNDLLREIRKVLLGKSQR